MHLDEEQIQRVVHRELTLSERATADEHLTHCAECQSRTVAAAKCDVETSELLRYLDAPLPSVSADAIIARAHVRRFTWVQKFAATFFVVSIGGVAWAASGSPIRLFLNSFAERLRGSASAPVNSPGAAPSVVAPVPELSGISYQPGQRVIINFTQFQPRGVALVSISGGTEVVVRAEAGAATFSSSGDTLTINNTTTLAHFEIEVPRSVARLDILVAGTRLYNRTGTRATAPDSALVRDTSTLSLARPDRSSP